MFRNLQMQEARQHDRGAPPRASLLLGIAVFIWAQAAAFARHPKLSPDLEVADPNAQVNVIIQFEHLPTGQDHERVRRHGGTLKSVLGVVKGASYSVPASALTKLTGDSNIAYISLNRQVKGSLDYAAAAVGANIAWQYGWDGSGIGVAVIDSGIAPGADLNYFKSSSSRIVYSQDFVSSYGVTTDLYGHGTHVAGIIGGNATNSTGPNFTATFKGIAPNAQLVNLRVLDQYGYGTDSSVIAAIQQAITLRDQYNIRVINLSLGRPVYESYMQDPLCQAVEAAWKAGIVVVVAAGNYGRDNSAGTNGYATITSPGDDPCAITVGAMKTMGTPSRSDDLIASYSSKGPTPIDHVVKPDLVAPGNRIASVLDVWGRLDWTYPTNAVPISYYNLLSGTWAFPRYYRLSGTSMATPMVSGAAALLLQANAQLTPDQVKARLMKTAYKAFPPYSTAIDPVTGAVYVSQYDIFTIGAGYLDIAAALASSDLATGTALSPTAVYNASQNAVYLVTDPTSVWNTSLIWGTSLVWGASVFVDSASQLWGTSVVWGASGTQGFSMIWGASIVWGTSSPTDSASSHIAIQGEK